MFDVTLEHLFMWMPFIVLALFWAIIFWTGQKIAFFGKIVPNAQTSLLRPMLMIILFVVVVISMLMVLPIEVASRGQLLNLLGVVAAAAIALSSTTFLGNIMAGFMLKSIKAYKPGDFIQVGDHFGRVSEWAMLHTEIQTEERTLTTLPNLFLVSNPVNVVRSSGTVVSAEVSLGYDTNHKKIKEALEKAVLEAGLEKPFVLITQLGDFSVNYKAAGFLTEVKSLISARSKLRECMLISLHSDDIEIVSPTFMNQRVFEKEQKFMYKLVVKNNEDQKDNAPEDMIFDKADKLESIESLKSKKKECQDKINAIKESVGKEKLSEVQNQEIVQLNKKAERINKLIELKEIKIEEEH